MIKRVRVNFKGIVQGVGFRYQCTYKARMLGLSGWVKNEYDGSVSAEIQGEENRINILINFLYNDKYIRIKNHTIEEIETIHKDFGFKAKY